MRGLLFLLGTALLAACGVQGHDSISDGDDQPAKSGRKSEEATGAVKGAAGDEGEVLPNGDDEPTADSDESDEADVGETQSALSYYTDAKPIIDAKCTPCHVDGGIGPMPLTTYAEVQPFLPLINNDVSKNIMPPWIANAPHGFFDGDRRLDTTQKKTLLSWIKQGAPEGDPADEPEAVGERTERGLTRVDLTLRSPEAYTPQIEPDDYRCFVFEWPYDSTKYITGINIAPEDRSMVHHAILYHVQPENAQDARDRDAADPGPGYSCFAATGGVSAWLQSYEPGGYGQGIPGELGFEIKPGSLMILQVHYNTLNGLGKDRSAVELALEDKVDRVGQVMLIMQPLWPAGGMPIPANDPDVPFAYRGRNLGLADDRDYGVYWVDLHMHQLGSSGRIGIIRADKPDELEVLLDIPKWDFKWQETYMLHEPNVLKPGDQLYVECHFDNTAEHQTVVNGERLLPRDVNWGEGTTDEMCLGNVLVTPL